MLRQDLSHAAAFNEGNVGCIRFPPHMDFANRYTVHFETKCNFMRWLNEHREYFKGVRSAARIAVWRPRENMAMSGRLAYTATMRMEQLLVETCRGFDFVLEESPKALRRYDLVVVPNVECMSWKQIEGLVAYAAEGGGLLIGQDAAVYDLWHRRRIENSWAALFGTASAKNVVADAVAQGVAGVLVAASTQNQSDAVTLVAHGKGRAAYCPMIVDPATQPSLMTVQGGLNCGLDYANWVIPERAKQINQALDSLLKGKERRRVSGERGLLAEFLRQEEEGRELIHLVNLRPAPQSHCEVELGSKVERSAISVLYPPTDAPPRWTAMDEKDGTRIVFDHLDVYAVVVVQTPAREKTSRSVSEARQRLHA